LKWENRKDLREGIGDLHGLDGCLMQNANALFIGLRARDDIILSERRES
jgi:hypothetical protein